MNDHHFGRRGDEQHAANALHGGGIRAETASRRDAVDKIRLMAVFNIENFTWKGSSEEKLEILNEARKTVESGLDDLHAALLAREQGKSPY
jgi:hypothetical protein